MTADIITLNRCQLRLLGRDYCCRNIFKVLSLAPEAIGWKCIDADLDATERRAAYNQGSAQPPKGTMTRQREDPSSPQYSTTESVDGRSCERKGSLPPDGRFSIPNASPAHLEDHA